MKNLIFVFAVILTLASCGNGSSTENSATTNIDTTNVKADSTVVVDSTAKVK
jgi:hypothetical protein